MRPPAFSRPVVGSEIELVALLETAYRNRDADLYQSLLADRDGAAFLFETRSRSGQVSTHWGVDKERRLHRRMFAPERTPADEPPVPDGLGIVDVAISLTPGTFRERTEYYESAGGALASDRWRALGGLVHVGLFVQTRGRPLDGVRGSVELVIIEDLLRPVGTPGKYLLYRWWDPTYKAEAAATPSMSWSALKLAYGEGLGIDCGGALVDELAAAYGARNLSRFEALLAHEPEAEFSAGLAVPTLDGRHTLDLEAELLLHRRLFTPETAPPPALDPGLHARTIQLVFDPITDFVETSPDGINLGRWRATRARYRAQLTVQTHSDEVLRSDWEVELVALEDRTLRFGQPGKFLLHRWSEPNPQVLPVDESGSNLLPVRGPETWSDIKIAYLPLPAIDSELTLVRSLAFAYKRRELARFAPLLAGEPGAEFAFVGLGGETWDRIEESRLHLRLFRPELAFPELPVDQRIASIETDVVLLGEFLEKPEYYAAPGRPGLDSARWRATGARLYFISTAWQQDGEGLVIGGESRWVVLEDRTKSQGEPGRYLLYRWLDEDGTLPSGWTSWTAFKSSYR